jgi:hypothetical protein
MTSLQTLLRESENGIEILKSFGIKCCYHKKYPNLHLFKYNQSELIVNKYVEEARGIILDKNDNWKIISYGFNRFFNYYEEHKAEINWLPEQPPKIYEKMDGSLMVLYFYDGNWQVSSSGVPDASAPINSKYTFASLFWEIFNEKGYALPANTNRCYMFEMVSPHNQIIIPYATNNLVLLGIRCIETLTEMSIEQENHGFDTPSIYTFENVSQVIEASKALDQSHEGFVICDEAFNRIKVKSTSYVEVTHVSGRITLKNLDEKLLAIIAKNEGDEFIGSFPEYRQRYEELQVKYQKMVTEISNKVQEVSNIKNKKDLADQIKNLWYKKYIFIGHRIHTVNSWLGENISLLMENW